MGAGQRRLHVALLIGILLQANTMRYPTTATAGSTVGIATCVHEVLFS